MKIPVYQPDLSGNEKKYVNECLDTTWISSKGKFVGEFEKEFAAYTGSKYAITVSNILIRGFLKTKLILNSKWSR